MARNVNCHTSQASPQRLQDTTTAVMFFAQGQVLGKTTVVDVGHKATYTHLCNWRAPHFFEALVAIQGSPKIPSGYLT